MARLILIISAVLIAISIVLGFMNRQKFITLREAKISANEQINQILADTEDTIAQIDDLKRLIAATEDERDIAREELSSTERQINSMSAKIAAADQKVKEADLRIAEVEEALGEYEGVTPETLNQRIEEMEKELALKEEEITQLQSEIEVAQTEAERGKEALQGLEQEETQRSQDIALNAAEATITAVNNDFGFVVVDVGRNRGVESDDLLIVRRGNQKIGQLEIISIEPSSLVANIIPSSLTVGSIVPGDKVVFRAGGATASN